MSFLDHLDQIFDLDMALTTLSSLPTADDDDHNTTAKLSDSISFGQQSHQIELPLPIVTAVVGVCTVCLESFKPSPEANRVVPCCGHVFHRTCIHKWLSLHNSCPLCRFDIAAAAVQASCE